MFKRITQWLESLQTRLVTLCQITFCNILVIRTITYDCGFLIGCFKISAYETRKTFLGLITLQCFSESIAFSPNWLHSSVSIWFSSSVLCCFLSFLALIRSFIQHFVGIGRVISQLCIAAIMCIFARNALWWSTFSTVLRYIY